MHMVNENNKWINLISGSDGMNLHPSLTTSQPLTPTSYSSPNWGNQVHESLNQMKAGVT